MPALDLFLRVIVPIFIMIGVGLALDKKFRLDLQTLSKLNFYVFVPALLFVKLLEAQIESQAMGRIAAFTLLHLVAMGAIGWAVFSMPRLRERRVAMTLGAMFYNCGNYGIPLVVLAFGNDAVAPLAVLIMVQNVATFTLGLVLFEKERAGPLTIALRLARLPVVLAVAAALICRTLEIRPWQPLGEPLRYLGDGLVPVALLTLGAQLARSLSSRNLAPLGLLSGIRLALSPLAGWAIAWALGFRGETLAVLTVVTGLPVAVNVYILSAEYRRGEKLASQAVFATTLLSALTVSVLLAIVT